MSEAITSRHGNKKSTGTITRRISKLRIASLSFLLLAFVLCVIVLVGWGFSLSQWKSFLYDQKIGLSSVLSLIYLIIAAAPAIFRPTGKIFKYCILAALILSISFGLSSIYVVAQNQSSLQQLALPSNFEIFNDSGSLGPIPIDIAFCVVWTSITIFCLNFFDQNYPAVFQSMSLLAILPSLLLVLAYIFGVGDKVDILCAYQSCVRLKYLNYTILLFLNAAMFLSRPAAGMTSLLVSNSLGGRQIRLCLVAMTISVPILGLISSAKRYEVINEPAMIVLSIVFFLILVGGLIAYNARSLDKINQEKEATEAALNSRTDPNDLTISYKMICLECLKQYPADFTNCPDDNAKLSRMMDGLEVGSIVAEKYRVEEALGSGGMSTVYKAHHLYFNQPVAIKILNLQLASDVKAVQRFQSEARSAHNLHHPNLLGVNDFGMSHNGQAYIVMDYLEGESLAQIIAREKKLPVERALPIFLDICRGMQFAHESGVLHRDIKPSNVMLIKDKDGTITAKIVDFGLAKSFAEADLKLTQTGEVHGSPLYMSPEQCRGIPADQRSDIYSIGVTMYETLSGKTPIIGATAYDTFIKKVSEDSPPLDPALNIPGWLSELILSCLSREPAKRPMVVRAVAQQISSRVKV